MKVSKAFEKLYNLLPKLDTSLLDPDQLQRVKQVTDTSYFYKDDNYQPPKKEFAYPKKFRLETERVINLLLKNIKLTEKRRKLLERINASINKEAFLTYVEELKTRPKASKKYLLSFLEKVKRSIKVKKIKNPVIPVFCYGSNGPAQLEVRLGRKIEAVPAYLPHHILTFNGMSSNWQSPAGSVMKLKDFAAIGSLIQVTEKELSLLDQFEGLGFAYKRKKVITSNGKANIYINMKKPSSNKPSRAYLKAVVTHLKSFWPTELVRDYTTEVFINQYDDTDMSYKVRGGVMPFKITAEEKKMILARRKVEAMEITPEEKKLVLARRRNKAKAATLDRFTEMTVFNWAGRDDDGLLWCVLKTNAAGTQAKIMSEEGDEDVIAIGEWNPNPSTVRPYNADFDPDFIGLQY